MEPEREPKGKGLETRNDSGNYPEREKKYRL